MRRFICLWLLALLCGCDCSDRTSRLVPKLVVLDEADTAVAALDFGKVQLNVSASQKVYLRNVGTAVLSLDQVEVSNAHFSVQAMLPAVIRSGDDLELTVAFVPTAADVREVGTAVLKSNDPNNGSLSLPLAGLGVLATAVVQPLTLDFGAVYLGEMKELTFALTNEGSSALQVSSAALSASVDATVTADVSLLVKTIAEGETAMVTLRFSPTSQVTLTGDLEIVLPPEIGNKTIPIRGTGVEAQPKLCFKFNDSAFESCTDGFSSNSLNLQFGALCDESVYPQDGGLVCLLDGGVLPYERSGQLYVRNEGNTGVSYALSIAAGQVSSCDGGASIDFQFAGAPVAADGGAVATWKEAPVTLPLNLDVAKPWEAPPLAVTYRAHSACKNDQSDLAIILWDRQGEPAGKLRQPVRMAATLTGSSAISSVVPAVESFGGNSSRPKDVMLVLNKGSGPVKLLGVELWQSADGGSSPDVRCATVGAGPCTYFAWAPGVTFPVLLEGTLGSGTGQVLGQIAYGTLDAGTYYPPVQEQQVFAIVSTSDPYAPTVTVPIVGRP